MTVLEELIAVLKTENQLLEELINLSVVKQKQINNAREVARLAKEEGGIVAQLEVVDQERALLFDLVAPNRDLESWISALTEKDQAVVAPLVSDLARNLAELQSLNALNQRLLAESLAFVRFSLNALLVDDSTSTYASSGSSSQSKKAIFDRKV